jgi:hypothetical protein
LGKISRIVEGSHAAFGAWRRTGFAERARLMAEEMGKPVADDRLNRCRRGVPALLSARCHHHAS